MDAQLVGLAVMALEAGLTKPALFLACTVHV
jgi:hypothetical protein